MNLKRCLRVGQLRFCSISCTLDVVVPERDKPCHSSPYSFSLTLVADHVTNKEVCAKIQQAIGPHEDLLSIVKRCKLQWYGHVSRSSGLAKTILQGTVKEGRRQGGQRKRWEDNIGEWTGLEFGKSQKAVENREKWRKLVAKSSMVPQRPSRLGIDDDDDESGRCPTWWLGPRCADLNLKRCSMVGQLRFCSISYM